MSTSYPRVINKPEINENSQENNQPTTISKKTAPKVIKRVKQLPTLKRAVGRPRVFKSPQQLLNLYNRYLVEIDGHEEPQTITGFCTFIKIAREDFAMYGRNHPEFLATVKYIRQNIESSYEKCLTTLRNPTGAIFALKNFGWKDEQTVEITTKITDKLHQICEVLLRHVPEHNRETAMQELRQVISQQ